jgi:hypothetical protein
MSSLCLPGRIFQHKIKDIKKPPTKFVGGKGLRTLIDRVIF